MPRDSCCRGYISALAGTSSGVFGSVLFIRRRAVLLRVLHLPESLQSDKSQDLVDGLNGYDHLDSCTLEALAYRMARLEVKWESRTFSSVPAWRLYLPQTITWLRLVAARTWLFVASSDNHVSKITCWDLSLVFQGCEDPLAEAYLPGQVKTGKLEVHDSGAVLALGLGASASIRHFCS